MTRRKTEQVIKVSPALAKLNRMDAASLRALMRSIPGVNLAALDRADEAALLAAAQSYLRIARLTDQQVMEHMEVKA